MNKRKWISVIAAFWSAAAIALSGEFVEANGLLRTLNSELNGIRLDKLIVLAALVAFYYKVWDRFVEESKWITHLLAAFFSVCMLIGISYSTQGSWVFFMGNRKQILWLAVQIESVSDQGKEAVACICSKAQPLVGISCHISLLAAVDHCIFPWLCSGRWIQTAGYVLWR